MKKITIAIFIITILVTQVSAINTLVADSAILDATLLRYTPNPAEPGDIMDVYVLISNEGSKLARNVVVEIEDNYPFAADSPLEAVKNVPGIPGQESYLAKFKVRIDKNADEGTNFLKVRFKSENTESYTERLLSLDVQSNDAAISIESIKTVPETIQPGEKASIEILIKNLADSKLRDIAATLSTSRTIGSTTTDLPFAPIGGSLEKRLSEMQAEETMKLTYNIIIDPDSLSDVYEIPLTIDFSDMVGNDYSISDEVGLIVNAKPALSVYTEESSLNDKQSQGDVTIRFVNRGLSEIKLLTATVQDSDDFDLLSSSSEYYVGNIDSDDYETASFDIKSNNADEINIPVKITYLDSLNNEFNEDVTLNLKIPKSNGNGASSSPVGLIVIIIVVALIVYFIYKRVKKKRRKRQ